MKLHRIEKHPFRCFHSEIQSTISEHEDSQLERDIATDKTQAEWIWEKIRKYIVFHPSKMETGRHWLRNYATELPTETDAYNTHEYMLNKSHRFWLVE